jgi:hypothetical protein
MELHQRFGSSVGLNGVDSTHHNHSNKMINKGEGSFVFVSSFENNHFLYVLD